MTKQDFKKKYLTDAFFWLNEKNHLSIQNILNEFNIKCHTGSGIIKYHKGFNKIATFNIDKFHDFEYYQKVDIFLPNARYGEPKNIDDLLNDYKTLN